MKKTYTIKGMACPHCSANVEKTLRALDGVEEVTVNLGDGTAEVIGEATPEAVCEAIRLAGYECEPEPPQGCQCGRNLLFLPNKKKTL